MKKNNIIISSLFVILQIIVIINLINITKLNDEIKLYKERIEYQNSQLLNLQMLNEKYMKDNEEYKSEFNSINTSLNDIKKKLGIK